MTLGRVLTYYRALSSREKMLVLSAVFGLGLYIFSFPISAIMSKVDNDEALAKVRSDDLKRITELLKVHQKLENRLTNARDTFAESQMTLEEVTGEADRILKESVGIENYDLKRDRPPSQVGLEYEKQEFTLVLRSLTLDQMIKLLYNLENEKRPLFLRKLHFERAGEALSARLEIFSIRKAKPEAVKS